MSYILPPMRIKNVNRWGASGVHLLISLAIAASALAFMLLLWYPPPLFKAAGGNDLLFILVGVDVIVGPLITLLIFKPGKWGLKFDLAAIGTLQLAALVYGLSIVYLARPAFIVFVKDRFEVATAAELEPENLARAKYEQFSRPPLGGPQLAFAEFPSDQKERDELVKLAFAGYDLQHFPKYWRPYEAQAKQVVAKGDTLDRMRKTEPKAARVVDEYLKEHGIRDEEVRFLNLRAPRAWVAVLVDAKTAEPRTMLLYEML
jgi:hypothetical protein